MIDKLKWALALLRSNSYVVLTDTKSVINIPIKDPTTFNSVFALSGQTQSLAEFHTRLENLIREHEEELELLQRRSKKVAKRPSTSSRNKAKKTSNKSSK